MKKLKSTTVYGALFVLFAIYSITAFVAYYAENHANSGIAIMGILVGALAFGMYIAYNKASWEARAMRLAEYQYNLTQVRKELDRLDHKVQGRAILSGKEEHAYEALMSTEDAILESIEKLNK